MKFDKKLASMIFNDTNISDIFITKYLPEAPGDAIKIYLYLLFQTKYTEDISVKSISDSINLSYNAVKSALDYWTEKGLLVKQGSGFIIRNIKEIELFEKYNPKISLSSKELKSKNELNDKADVIDNINKQFFQGIMSPVWVQTIYTWFEKFNFTDEVMFALFQYGKDKNVLNKNYIEQVALGWNREDITNYEDLNNYLSKRQVIYLEGKKIAKKLRLYRNLSAFEEEYVKKWFLEYKFKEEIIDLGLKIAGENGTASFKYLDTIFSDWHNNKLYSIEEIEKYIKENKLKFNKEQVMNQNKKIKEKINLKNPHKERHFTNLDEFYD